MPNTIILALVRDLLLRSRIEAVADTLGAEVTPAATLELARTRASRSLHPRSSSRTSPMRTSPPRPPLAICAPPRRMRASSASPPTSI